MSSQFDFVLAMHPLTYGISLCLCHAYVCVRACVYERENSRKESTFALDQHIPTLVLNLEI